MSNIQLIEAILTGVSSDQAGPIKKCRSRVWGQWGCRGHSVVSGLSSSQWSQRSRPHHQTPEMPGHRSPRPDHIDHPTPSSLTLISLTRSRLLSNFRTCRKRKNDLHYFYIFCFISLCCFQVRIIVKHPILSLSTN